MFEKSKFWEELKSGRFASMVKESSQGKYLSNSREAYHILKPLFAGEDDVEQAYFIFLDAKNKILSIEKLFSGSINSSTIYVREIVKKIIMVKSTGIILGHNHPSGVTTPSPEDKAITIKIGIAAAAMDVHFHDHIIVGDGYHSMADSGFLKIVSQRFTKILTLG
jgi:DNA repair protein RadC